MCICQWVFLVVLLYMGHPVHIQGNPMSTENDTLHDAVDIISMLNFQTSPLVHNTNFSESSLEKISGYHTPEIGDINISYIPKSNNSSLYFNLTSFNDAKPSGTLAELDSKEFSKGNISATFYEHLVQSNKSENQATKWNVSLEMLKSFIPPAAQPLNIKSQEREVSSESRKGLVPPAECQVQQQDKSLQKTMENSEQVITKVFRVEPSDFGFQVQSEESVKSETRLIYSSSISPETFKGHGSKHDDHVTIYGYQGEVDPALTETWNSALQGDTGQAISNKRQEGVASTVGVQPEEVESYTVPKESSESTVNEPEDVSYLVPEKKIEFTVKEQKEVSYTVPEKSYESPMKEAEEGLPYRLHVINHNSTVKEMEASTDAPKVDVLHYAYEQNDLKSSSKDMPDNWTVQAPTNTIFHREGVGTTNEPEIKLTEELLFNSSPWKNVETSHPCVRPCVKDGHVLNCSYSFTLEWYFTMSKACYSCPLNISDCYRPDCITADGIKRPVTVVNRMLPGPNIEVCLGDTIIVDVKNMMMGESTTIHWHGHHQRGTPYMDGVPFVTQCPIPPKATFRYQYKADCPGTHFWHSHTGCQRADGVFGAFIVRSPQSQDPHSNLYDFDLSEHIIQILDWSHEIGLSKFLAHHHSDGNNKPLTILVNGRGRYFHHQDIVNDLQRELHMPVATFTVKQGYRYRFRLINAGFLNCPIEMSVDNHTLTVISSDGFDFRPVDAESLVSYAGERFDFILNANQPMQNYWIRFRGLMDCDERFTSAHQVALLNYKGAPTNEEPIGNVTYDAAHRKGRQVNSLNVGPGTNSSLVISELNALTDDVIALKNTPDMQFYVSYDFYDVDNPHFHRAPYYGFHQVSTTTQLYTPQLNHISLKLPPFPLLSQHNDLGPNAFCNESTVTNCEQKYCKCTHVVQIPLGTVLELILIDKGVTYDANHPFHLHGNAFRVIAMDRLGRNTTVEEVQSLDNVGAIKRKLYNAPIKDTVTVPDGGYTIVRVHATNPGYWLFHCHIEFHAEIGMALVFKVGQHSDFPPVPQGFPICGNYFSPEEHSSILYEIVAPTNHSTHWQAIKTTVPSGVPHVYSSYFKCFTILLFCTIVR